MTDNTTEEMLPCRSHDEHDKPCVKKRGHKQAKHSDGEGGYWIGGVNTKPVAVPKNPPPRPPEKPDDGYMTEGDYQSWGRLFR